MKMKASKKYSAEISDKEFATSVTEAITSITRILTSFGKTIRG